MAAISYILQGTESAAASQDANKHCKSPKYDQHPRSYPVRH
jgi:hypothetical protein